MKKPLRFGAIPVHHTKVDKESAWDAGENLKRLGDSPSKDSLRAMHAWVDSDKDAETKTAYKLPHHEVSTDGVVGDANLKGLASAVGRLNGGGLDIPEADRKAVHAHLAAHYKDAGEDAPELKNSADLRTVEYFGDPSDDDEDEDEDDQVLFMPATANAKDGTIDCVWYAGATVPRQDPETYEPYMLSLDMEGCRMERLNAGAPVFDAHFSGDDFKSVIAGKTGTKAQVGVVRKAWADGKKGRATLQFDMGSDDGQELFRKASRGIVQNLSFGAWIYKREKQEAAKTEALQEGAPPYSNPNEMGMFSATDWEPFEISPVTVPADFGTTFLSAQPGARATRPKEPIVPELNNAQPGADAQAQLAAARAEAVTQERSRVTSIRTMASPFKLKEEFVKKLIDDGTSVDDSRVAIMTHLSTQAQADVNGNAFPIRESVVMTRDQRDAVKEQMEAALLVRHDPVRYKDLAEKGREFAGLTLLDMARECLTFSGVKVRGIGRFDIARIALQGRYGASEYFGAESTSDFPAILANVANKTLRQAYEAYPRTFQPFCRQVTAADFKPVNRVQLNDIPALQKLNEKGEYHRAQLNDSNQNYSLATYGEVVAITRKVIINDDLQAFTRVPALLGVAAAQLESNTVWAVITSNQVMQVDDVALFNSAHANLLTGSGSALQLSALASARQELRLQTGPNGTHLNLIPRFILLPAALETAGLQLIYPLNIASTVATAVVPEWVRSLVPVIEPRLDAASSTAWYLVADPAQIDTVEYAYLEGQQGVYIETRQGFEVDGVEIKARLDFAAAAIDFRGMQKNAGA
jgi:hypothetical protein